MTRSVARTFAILLAGGLALTSCGGASEEPTSADVTQSEEAPSNGGGPGDATETTAPADSSPDDTLPADAVPLKDEMAEPGEAPASEFTEESAAAFVDHAMAAIIWGYATNDPSKLEAISSPTSDYLRAVAEQMRENSALGKTRHGGLGTLTEKAQVTLDQEAQRATATAPYHLTQGWTTDGSGAVIEWIPETDLTATFQLQFADGTWKLDGIAFEDPTDPNAGSN